MKRTNFFLFLLIYILILSTGLYAQITHPDLEKYLEQLEDVAEQSQLLEQLEDLLKHPLNLNKVSLQEMLLIPGFPEKGAFAILQAQKSEKGIVSIEQAQKLITDDLEVWDWISQFVTIEGKKQPLVWNLDGRVRFVQRQEKSKGFEQNIYQGTPSKIYQRYRFTIPGRLKLATLFEKDPGETKIRDHQILNIEYQLPSLNTKMIAGNYTVNLGFGLMLWSPFSVRKGSAPFYSVRRNEKVIRPFLSSFEANYFQGIAVQSTPGSWDLVGWTSDLKNDANVADNGFITSFYESGYHRSKLEREKQNKATIKSTGISIGKTFFQNFKIQINRMDLDFNPGIQSSTSEPLDFQFHGKKQQYSGISFFGNFGSFNSFGEVVWQNSQGLAAIAGTKGQWKKTKLLVLHRYYSPKYFNPYSQGFGETSTTNNESGWYVALQFSPISKSKITLAADQFSSSWKTYYNPLKQSGSDFYIQWEQRINLSFNFYLRYTNDNKPQILTREYEVPHLRELMILTNRDRIRFHFSMKLAKESQINGRFETVRFAISPKDNFRISPSSKNGWLFYWDFRSKYLPNSLISTRITLFDTPTYNTRLYQFENDLPGILNSKLLYGRGIRFYFLLKFELWQKLQFSTKYSSTRYENRETIGSGWDLINSPVEHLFSFQLDWNI